MTQCDSLSESDAASYIASYVARLKESGDLNDPAVEQAFRKVPRHLFVGRFFTGDEEKGWTEVDHDPVRPRREHLEIIYSSAALITRLKADVPTSSTSQPALVAQMLELLELGVGMRVLEIGAGTGYNAALTAEIVGDHRLVRSIDIQQDVVDDANRSLERAGYSDVRVLCKDGFEGEETEAPFDRIVATVGCPDISPRWVDQLAPSGSMLVPLRHGGANPLVRVRRDGEGVVGNVVGNSGFMKIQGRLLNEDYYDQSELPPDSNEVERAAWPELGAPPGEKIEKECARSRTAFWFYLGLREQRTRIFKWFTSFGLDDKASGRTARLEDDRLVGEPALLDELEGIYREWRDLGAPDIRQFGVRFVPKDSNDGDRLPQGLSPELNSSKEPVWTSPGPFYWKQFFLARTDMDD